MHPLVRWQFQGGLEEADRKAFLFTNIVNGKGRKYDIPVVVGAVAVDMDIGPVRFAEAVLTVTLLGLTFGGLALAIGCITGNRGLALGVSSTAAVSTFVANALGEIADFIDPAKWVSPFYYYNDANVLANGLNPAHAAVLAAAAAVLVGIGYRAFQRRDLRL